MQSANFLIEAIAESADIKHIDFARLVVGVTQFGAPLPGTTPLALAPIMPLADAEGKDAELASEFATSVFSLFDLSDKTLMEAVESATPAQAASGARAVMNEVRRLRRWSHKRREQPFRESKKSTNILTAGQPAGAMTREFRKNPNHFTAADTLGAIIALCVAFEATGLSQFAQMLDFLSTLGDSGGPPDA